MLQIKIKNHKVHIYIDSQAAIRALSSYDTKSRCVLDCKELLNKLGEINDLTISWVPGHEGHMGNEVADRLAKRGINKETYGPNPIIPLNHTVTKQQIRKWALKQHTKEWAERSDCRQTKLLLPEVNKTWSRDILRKSRQAIRVITQIIIGHAELKRHRYLMGLETEPTCNKCEEEEETSEHFLLKCPVYAKLRYQIFGKAIMKTEDIRMENIPTILKYIENTKRFYNT